MSIVLLTNLRTRYSLPIVEALSQTPDMRIAHVIFVDRISSGSSLLSLWRQHGARQLLTKGLRSLERRIRLGRARRSLGGATPTQMKWKFTQEFVLAKGIPHSIVSSVNTKACQDLVKSLGDVRGLVCSCSQILSKKTIATFKNPPINIHPSPLPKYRGPRPAFWMLLHEEENAAVTFHEISPAIDDGSILAQFPVVARGFKSEDTLMEALFKEAGRHVAGVLGDHDRGEIAPHPQELGEATYQSFPTLEERRQYAVKGLV